MSNSGIWQILMEEVWSEASDSAFLGNSQGLLLPLEEPHFEEQGWERTILSQLFPVSLAGWSGLIKNVIDSAPSLLQMEQKSYVRKIYSAYMQNWSS